jgi:hypothetical protein
VPRGQRDGSLRSYSRVSRQEPLLFYQVARQLYSRGQAILKVANTIKHHLTAEQAALKVANTKEQATIKVAGTTKQSAIMVGNTTKQASL